MKRAVFAVLLILGLSGGARADEPSEPPEAWRMDPAFTPVGDAEVFSGGNVSALAQDRAGFLWIGTPEGLLRYDGYRFRRFSHDPQDPQALAGGFVNDLLAAQDGRVWVGTDSGVSVFDPVSERFTNYRHRPEFADSLTPGPVRALAEDRAGGVWIGTDSGLNYWAPASDGFVRYRHLGGDPRSLSDDQIFALLVDRHGDLWVGTALGVDRGAADSSAGLGQQGFERVLRAEGSVQALEEPVRALFETAAGQIWMGAVSGAAFAVDPARQPPAAQRVAIPGTRFGQEIRSMAEPSTGELWLGRSNGGIDLIDAATRRALRRLLPDPGSLTGLPAETRRLLRDRSGVLWLGGYGAGLRRRAPEHPAIGVLRPPEQVRDSDSRASVVSLLELSDGTLWLGTAGSGIEIVTGRFEARTRLLGDPQRANALRDGFVSALAQDHAGSIWIGSNSGVLQQADATGETISPPLPAADGIGQVRALCAEANGELWIGTLRGLFRLGPDRSLRSIPQRGVGGPLPQVSALARAADGRLWAATGTGLFVVERGETAASKVGRSDGQARDGLSSPNALGLLLDSRGSLWIDTNFGLDRLLSWDGERAKFDHVSTRLGIGGSAFGGNLLEDERGRIWSPRYVYVPATDSVYALTAADGVSYGTNWFRAYAKLRDGRMLFGGSKGVLLVDPERFEPWSYEPPLVISEFKIDGVARPLGEAHGITLTPDERGFSLEFAALDFSLPERNRYTYRLDGYDRDWIETDAAHRVASYGNLWPGDYQLHVRGSNRTGAFSPRELRVRVTVLPAFWQTAWFAALLLFAASGAAYRGFRWRTARIRQRACALQALVEQRTAELRGSHEQLQASKDDLETAHTQLTATHTQLEAAHTELESTHSRLASAHEQLATTHTRLLDTQQQLVLSEKMAALGTLTAGVAHEINNPLNFADVSAQNLRAALEDLHRFLIDLAGGNDAPAEVLDAFAQRIAALTEMSATTREGLKRIKIIVQDLRQFTRLDEAERKRVPIAEPIQSTVNLIRTRYDRIRFDLNLNFNPQIDCQAARLGQVFMSLIVNACEAIERVEGSRKGLVSVQTRSIVNDEIEIVVEDNGCGMDAGTQTKVFEPFFTTKPVGAGTGLGLATAFGIVKEHGGRIEVESNAGQGSRFVVVLPLPADRSELR